jgi:hypothetical protein
MIKDSKQKSCNAQKPTKKMGAQKQNFLRQCQHVIRGAARVTFEGKQCLRP